MKKTEKAKQVLKDRRLRGLMMTRGVTNEEMAEALGITPRSLRNRIRNRDWRAREIVIMRNILAVPTDELLEAIVPDYKRPDAPLMKLTLAEIERLAQEREEARKRMEAEEKPIEYPEMTDADFERIEAELSGLH